MSGRHCRRGRRARILRRACAGLLGSVDLVSVRADRLRPLASARPRRLRRLGEIDGIGRVSSRLRSLQAVALERRHVRGPLRVGAARCCSPATPRSRRAADQPAGALGAGAQPGRRRARRPADAGDGGALGGRRRPVRARGVRSRGRRRARPPRAAGLPLHFERAARVALASGEVRLALGPPRVASALRAAPRGRGDDPERGSRGPRARTRACRRERRIRSAPTASSRTCSSQAAGGGRQCATGLTPAVRQACGALGRASLRRAARADQWGARVQFAHRPELPAAPWSRWVSDWRSLAP